MNPETTMTVVTLAEFLKKTCPLTKIQRNFSLVTKLGGLFNQSILVFKSQDHKLLLALYVMLHIPPPFFRFLWYFGMGAFEF